MGVHNEYLYRINLGISPGRIGAHGLCAMAKGRGGVWKGVCTTEHKATILKMHYLEVFFF